MCLLRHIECIYVDKGRQSGFGISDQLRHKVQCVIFRNYEGGSESSVIGVITLLIDMVIAV